MKFSRLFPVFCLGLMAFQFSHAVTEEQKVHEISKKLKNIPDSQWSEIVGAKVQDTYEIQKGDTLWDVSRKLFGNPFYWPKVWSLNNQKGITNPHFIKPGNSLIFIPGTEESLPSISTSSETLAKSNEASSTLVADSNNATAPTGTKEYDRVSQDLWKPIVVEKQVSQQYDEVGLEKDIKILPSTYVHIKIPVLANDIALPYLGSITGSRQEGVGLSQGEVVFIKSEGQDLQVGTTYSTFSDAQLVKEKKSDRACYVYRVTGDVRIIGIKDDVYVGLIEKAYDIIKRGDKLYPMLPSLNSIRPVAATEAIESVAILNPLINSWSTAQFHFVHFDRGLEDGVNIGNVFRIYNYYDPQTKEKLTDNDMILTAEAIVVHATAQFSTALILKSKNTFTSADFGVLMTDISSLEKSSKNGSESKNIEQDKELDELDALDNATSDGLGKQEEQEVKQLENWDQNKDKPLEDTSTPESSDSTTDQVPADQQPSDDTTEPAQPEEPAENPPLEESQDLQAQPTENTSAEPMVPDAAPPNEAAPVEQPASPPATDTAVDSALDEQPTN